jgi:predicted glutamine amidotransferase
MCLLIHKPADAEMTEALILDVYSKNKDGFGVMYIDELGEFQIVKTLAGPDEIIPMYKKHCEGRECVIHFRMQTHGDVDLDNCHPYQVTDRVWMAHNGILSCGNTINPEKSDTWHFIEYCLKQHIDKDPDMILEPRFQDFIGDMIGSSNKFAFMRDDGEVVIINKDAGVEHMGMWLSNTYAWTPHKFGYYSAANKYSSYYSKSLYEDDFIWSKTNSSIVNAPLVENKDEKKLNYRKVAKAAYNSWRRGASHLRDWVYQAPHKATFFLAQCYETSEAELEEMVIADPEEAADWIADIFATEDNVLTRYDDLSWAS